jgi:hypothetical protein
MVSVATRLTIDSSQRLSDSLDTVTLLNVIGMLIVELPRF